MSLERPLRLFTLLATAIAVPLNVATTIVSVVHENYDYWRGRPVTTFCFAFIPLGMTMIASSMSLQYTKKHGKGPTGLNFKLLDLVTVLAYLGVLIPIWVIEIRKLGASGFGLLAGYSSNHEVLLAVGALLARAALAISSSATTSYRLAITGTTQTTAKKGYSLLHGEDYLDVEAKPIQYRDSEDFLGEGTEKAEQAKQAEDSAFYCALFRHVVVLIHVSITAIGLSFILALVWYPIWTLEMGSNRRLVTGDLAPVTSW